MNPFSRSDWKRRAYRSRRDKGKSEGQEKPAEEEWDYVGGAVALGFITFGAIVILLVEWLR